MGERPGGAQHTPRTTELKGLAVETKCAAACFGHRVWLTWPEPCVGMTGGKTRQEVHSFMTYQPQDTPTQNSLERVT